MILHKQKTKICPQNQTRDQTKLLTSDNKKKKASLNKINPSLYATIRHKKENDSSKKQQFFNNENENFNNIQKKPRQTIHEKVFYLQSKSKQKLKRRMYKSASVGKLNSKTYRKISISPQESKQEFAKFKFNSKKGHGTERESLKKNKKCIKSMKKSESHKNAMRKTIKTSAPNIKIEGISKMPLFKNLKDIEEKRMSLKKGQTKKKTHKGGRQRQTTNDLKNKKKISFKQEIQKSIFISEQSFEKMEFLESQIPTKENFYMPTPKPILSHDLFADMKKRNEAATLIQKIFRGFLARKYCKSIKYIVENVIKIQRFWRGYQCRRNYREKKRTGKIFQIYDYSIGKRKELFERKEEFNIDDFKRKKTKKIGSTEKKNLRQASDDTLAGILESLLQEEDLDEKIKQKIRLSLANSYETKKDNAFIFSQKKKQYIQNKIKSQIRSEKVFNSPKEKPSPKIPSPPSSSVPSQKTSAQSPTVKKFQIPKNNENSNLKQVSFKSSFQNSLAYDHQSQVFPFDTSLYFIEELCFRIIDYFRYDEDLMCNFCERLSTHFFSQIWNRLGNNEQNNISSFLFLLETQAPTVFQTEFVRSIEQCNVVRKMLEDGRYFVSRNENEEQKLQCLGAFKRCIYDAFTQGIYQNFKDSPFYFINLNQKKNLLFMNVMLHAILQIRSWCEYGCKFIIPEEEEEEFEGKHKIELMVREDVRKSVRLNDEGLMFWVKTIIGEILFKTLLRQILEEIHAFIQVSSF